MIRHGKQANAFIIGVLFLILFTLCLGFVPGTVLTADAKSNLGDRLATDCASVHVIGIRGSGEQRNSAEIDMGNPGYATYKLFADKMREKGISVDGSGLEYPATAVSINVPALLDSYYQGVSLLAKTIWGHQNACPSQQIILIGYSQGGMVIRRVLEDLPVSQRGSIKAVLIFGDPFFNPADKFSVTNYRHSQSGILGKENLPSWLTNARDYCLNRDPLCNGSLVGPTVCIPNRDGKISDWCAHISYNGDNTSLHEETSSWLAGLFTSPSNSNSPRLTTDCGHLKTPWVALYEDSNYSGRQLCFEGTGWIYLDQYDFSEKTSSVNIAANVSFYDKYRDELNYGYGYQTGNMGSWNDKIVSILVTS